MSPAPLSRSEMKRQAAARHNARYEAEKHRPLAKALFDLIARLTNEGEIERDRVNKKVRNKFNSLMMASLGMAISTDAFDHKEPRGHHDEIDAERKTLLNE